MRTITIKRNGYGRYDDVSPIVITDKVLELKVILPDTYGEFYFLAQNNGNTYKKLIPKEGKVSFSELSAGEFTAEVRQYLKGEEIKRYLIDTIILTEVGGQLIANSEIELLKKDIAALSGKIAAQEKLLQQTIPQINESNNVVQEHMLAMLKFAYTAYCDIVYLNGDQKTDSVDKFATEFGFILTEDEKNYLKGE